MWMETASKFLPESGTLGHEVLEVVVLLVVTWLSYVVTKRVVLRAVNKVFSMTKNTWDDFLVEHRVVHTASYLVPALVFFYGMRFFPDLFKVGGTVVSAVILIIVILVLDRLMNCLLAIYQTFPISMKRPLKGYQQLVKLIIYIFGAIFLISIIMGRSPWALLSGIGALTAVLMLIFKDTILSFVASIQIAGNDLIHKGDWITMPTFGADGDVIDVSLHTVKVQNFDKTVVGIPTNKFLDNSFTNWRGMQESGGRRIKRSVLIDQSSIRFLDAGMVEKLRGLQLLRPYLQKKEQELAAHNADVMQDTDNTSSLVNGRHMTNIGVFRVYVKEYLKSRRDIHQRGMTMLVRHKTPEASRGLPLEIYCFTTTTAWEAYEDIQSDIFDHILASLPEFGLRAYQRNALVDGRTE